MLETEDVSSAINRSFLGGTVGGTGTIGTESTESVLDDSASGTGTIGTESTDDVFDGSLTEEASVQKVICSLAILCIETVRILSIKWNPRNKERGNSQHKHTP